MNIQVLYFGGAKAATGLSEESFQLSQGAHLSDLQQCVAERHRTLVPHLESCRWALNEEFCGDRQRVLSDGDVLALIPPVQGGAPLASLVHHPIDEAAVLDRVSNSAAGAVVSFVGRVRDHARGRRVSAIEYEAYEPMALRVLERIAADQMDGVRVAIEHRLGRLEVGEAAVVIAASSPHRDEAFACTRGVLEALKTDVPIWKHEHYADGSDWVGWGGG